jgi:acyl-coenzyme A synthetase/AMP-(fatty) acid ligase
MSGRLTFITGGTSRTARLIEYNDARWQRSVRCKAAIFRSNGIDTSSRVAVCHPFAPWSIGQVHVEGALACGASVFPFGLSVNTPEIQDFLMAVQPSHLCGGARNLIRIAQALRKRSSAPSLPAGGALLVAGEMLTQVVRDQCEDEWQARVVNVYGMAEFDALGAELPGFNGVCLLDEFEFSLNVDDRFIELAEGAVGTLAVRGKGDTEWHNSGDIVEVLQSGPLKGAFCHSIVIVGRADVIVNFADGSAISEIQVLDMLSKLPELRALQIQVFTPDERGEVIRVICVPNGPVTSFDFERVRDLVRNLNVDVADSFKAGVIRDCVIDIYPTERALVETARGKRPLAFSHVAKPP